MSRRLWYPAVLRTQLAGIARRPARLVLTGLSVLIAAFVAFGTLMAYHITVNTTLDTFSGTPAGASLVITANGGDPLAPDALAKIRAVPGVAAAAAQLSDMMRVGGVGDGYLAVTADPGTGPLARVRVVQGAYPTGPGQLAVDRSTADRLSLAPGSRLTLRRQNGDTTTPVAATVTAVVDGPKTSGAQAYAPDTVAAALTGASGFYRVDVHIAPGTPDAPVMAALRSPAGPSSDIRAGENVRLAEAQEKVRNLAVVFQLVGVFVAVAGIAAALVASSTFRIVFAQRMRQFALLRTIGGGRAQLTRALIVEGAVTGLVAGAVGVVLAEAVGLVAPFVARTLGFRLSSPGIPLVGAVLIVAGATLVTVGAVLAPALSAAKVAPLQALRSASTTAGRRGIGVLRLVTGLTLAVLGGVIAAAVWQNLPGPDSADYSATDNLGAVVASGTLIFGALMALGPILVGPVLRVVGWPLRRLGPTGRLAVGGVGGAPRRAAAVSVVVALGVTLVSGTLVGVACLRGYAEQGLAVNNPADFAVHSQSGALPVGIVQRLRAAPALADVTGYREVEVEAGGPLTTAADLSLTALPALRTVRAATGKLGDLGPGRVILSGPFAEAHQLSAGDTVTVRAGGHAAQLTVAATLPGAGPLGEDLLVTPRDLDALGVPAATKGVLANAAHPGIAARNAAQAVLAQAVADDPRADVDVLAQERDDTTDDLNLLLLTALGLLGLTVLVAVVGVGTTTALSVLERVQESGLLRALGLGRAKLRFMLSAEAALYGVVGAVLGLALGVPYAWLAVAALPLNAPLLLPVGQLAVLFVVLAAMTALTGLLPARRAARVSPVAALGTPE